MPESDKKNHRAFIVFQWNGIDNFLLVFFFFGERMMMGFGIFLTFFTYSGHVSKTVETGFYALLYKNHDPYLPKINLQLIMNLFVLREIC